MEKRLHNTRHAARQARNSGKASSTASNRTNSGGSGASSATAERMTVNTTTSASPNSKATTSAPSPPPVAASSVNHHREQTSAPASSARHRQQHQQSVKQSDSSDEDNEDNEDEEMEDDAASPSPPGALATPTSPPSTPVTPTATGRAPSSSTSVTATTTPSASPEQMYEGFQAWALRTYGDSAKTKTVTRKKYQRILKILKGEEQTSAENSKFRFWVKAKGFKMGLPPGHPQQSVHKAALAAAAAKSPPEQLLFVPCSKVKKGGDGETTVYKRVAVVENFFEIIYGVHVEMDGRGGKHAGQKRTYKAIAELYAFLPREAVTHFLMSCSDCQKRMHLTNGALSAIVTAAAAQGSAASSPAHNSGGATAAATTPSAAAAPPPTTTETASSGYHSNDAANTNNHNNDSCRPGSGGAGSSGSPSRDAAGGANAPSPARTCSSASSPGGAAVGDASAPGVRAAGARIAAVSAADVDFSVPITTAYLKHMRSLGLSDEDAFNPREDSTLGSDELSDDEATPNYEDDEEASPDAGVLDSSKETSDAHMADASASTRSPRPASEDAAGGSSAKTTGGSPTTSASRRSCTDEPMDTQQPLNMTAKTTATTSLPGGSGFPVSGGSTEHSFADRGQSPPTAEPDDLSAGTKDEDEEDDDDEQDKLDISSYDPERLKAFNMFVRLFVDENLDRMVPISRQPKEKIQAIIDSCSRQFPEFAERARKRIRTYLKSCRRTKRTRDLNGWDVSGRTAVPHLTSPLAEQILASACENETNNAKRMRLGLQPLPMELDIPGRSTTPGYHVTVGVGGSNGASTVLGVPASLSVNSSAPSMTNNVSSQLISRLTAPIVSSNASATNGLLSTSLSSVTAGGPTPLTAAASSVVPTSGVDVTTVCPFHMHHHHQQQQQFHQHFAVATSANPSVTSNGILTSPGTVTSSSSSSSPVNSFMNGVVAGAVSPHTPHTHHHHKCFNNNVSATNGVGLTATVTSAANGHHYHVHHRHPGGLGGTSVSSSSSSCSGSNNNNSPTDLSVKKCVGNGVDSRPAMALKYSLNPAEVNAVKQLIAGYRESAAFLLRSADELEQLLLQQN
uniref:PNUTS protein n=1 Tax=Rhipicephalus zambeziensis TaxID=60191 RepID=A0A224YPH1_9ACAR